MPDPSREAIGRPEGLPYDADSLTDVAFSVFRERGFDATSIVDIAKAAGLTKSSLYHHVAGKEALLGRGLERALDALFGILVEEGARSGAAVDRLFYVLKRSIEVELALLAEVTVLLRARGNTETERKALDRRRAFDRMIAEIVAEAQREGTVRADVDPVLMTRLVFGMLNGLTDWYRPGGPVSPTALTDGIRALVFEGLTPPRAES
ncbi:MAG: TetR/AcrR family transcriptional regulator [Acidimicrobiales bacterium]